MPSETNTSDCIQRQNSFKFDFPLFDKILEMPFAKAKLQWDFQQFAAKLMTKNVPKIDREEEIKEIPLNPELLTSQKREWSFMQKSKVCARFCEAILLRN